MSILAVQMMLAMVTAMAMAGLGFVRSKGGGYQEDKG